MTYGWGLSRPDLTPGVTRLVVLWGTHPSASNPPAWGHIRKTQRAGAALMVIDPRHTVVVAERWWYPERQGASPELYGIWESNINAYTDVSGM